MATVRAINNILKFPVRLLFPRNEPFSIPLIALMLATDDLRHLKKLLIVRPDSGPEATGSERAILEGEVGHLFRLLCGHLCEAMEAFETLDKGCAGLLDAAATDDRGREALARVRQAYPVILHRAGGRSFIDVVRNLVTFHYIGQKLSKALEKYEREGYQEDTLVLSPFQGFCRYTVTDNLVKFLIADEIGSNWEEFQKRYKEEIGQSIDLAGALEDVVAYLLGHLLAKHQDKIEQYEEVITIDPAIEQAREKVERARSTGDPR